MATDVFAQHVPCTYVHLRASSQYCKGATQNRAADARFGFEDVQLRKSSPKHAFVSAQMEALRACGGVSRIVLVSGRRRRRGCVIRPESHWDEQHGRFERTAIGTENG